MVDVGQIHKVMAEGIRSEEGLGRDSKVGAPPRSATGIPCVRKDPTKENDTGGGEPYVAARRVPFEQGQEQGHNQSGGNWTANASFPCPLSLQKQASTKKRGRPVKHITQP